MQAPLRNESAPDDVSTLKALAQLHQELLQALESRIFGQREAIEHMLVTLFAGGHALLVGVPGLGKTLLVQSIAQVLDLDFSRIQFTPDLMPGDVTGTQILDQSGASGARSFRFDHGPIFCNLLLADEINRTPPKTQSALLEAMQEQRVSSGGQRHLLPSPFCVFATRNPIEQEGTYALPEAQLDRFMLQIYIDYPDQQAEHSIVTMPTQDKTPPLAQQVSGQEILHYQDLVARIPVPDPVAQYVVQLIRSTRPSDPSSPEIVRKYVHLGAGPRAGQLLVRAAKAHAALRGHAALRIEDIQALAPAILAHRLILHFEASADNIDPRQLVRTLVGAPGAGA